MEGQNNVGRDARHIVGEKLSASSDTSESLPLAEIEEQVRVLEDIYHRQVGI